MRRKWLCATLAALTIGIVVPLCATGASADPRVRGAKAKAVQAPPAGPYATDSYYVPYATGPNGERVPVMDIPSSVTVVPRTVMDDQHATSICGAAGVAAGVSCR
jgi:outer membrane receptor for monomeric catechols